MADVIRNATILVHLKSGPVNLKAPDLSPFLSQLKQQADLYQRIEAEAKKLDQVQGAEVQRQRAEAENAVRNAADQTGRAQEFAGRRTALAYRQAFEALTQTGEGFFRLGRATVLLGASSDESFNKMIRGLAQVQAYFDIFKGTIQIILGVEKAIRALAAAQALETAAARASALAHGANEGAMVAGTVAAGGLAMAKRALATALSTVGGRLTLLVGVVALAAAAWDALTTSEAEAAEQAKESARALEEATAKVINAQQRQRERILELESLKREGLPLGQRSAAAQREAAGMLGAAQIGIGQAIAVGGGGERQTLEFELQRLRDADKLRREAVNTAKELAQQEIRARDAIIQQIEARQRALDASQRQLDVEREKERMFRVQIGSLNQFDLQQLKAIDARMKAGQQLNQFEVEFMAEKGGGRGRREAEKIQEKNFDKLGLSADFLGGAGKEMGDAAKEVADLSKALADFLKDLQKGDTGAKAIAALKSEQEQIQKVADATTASLEKMLRDRVIPLFETVSDRLNTIEETQRRGGL